MAEPNAPAPRRLPAGAELLRGGGVHFRVWAPLRHKIEVVLKGGGAVALVSEGNGYFSGRVPGASAGTLYRFRLDGEEPLCPDPVSRFQPDGPHGPSQVIDPDQFSWSDQAWKGISIEGQILYEMHFGTFTQEGTYRAAAAQLEELRDTGITVIEVMPVAEFPGAFGWGYDGVGLFAPYHVYGDPDDFRRFVDRAHSLGLGVVLDVVYNHFGPDGNYMMRFSDAYFTKKYEIEWGDAVNFDGPDSGPVREFFVSNARYWIREFHLDGLRLDATQSIHDASPVHVLAEISRAARDAAGGRSIILVAENEPQQTKLVRGIDQGGYGLDALWNDDFHHSAMVAMTGRNEAYCNDYLGRPQEFVSAAKYGYLYQGQLYSWQGKRRGQPSFGIGAAAFVNYIQNHDQVANSGRGERCNMTTDPGRLKAMTALLLLAPGTPMLFQGQEFASSSPFFYFADHNEKLAPAIRQGRVDFLAQFRSLNLDEVKGIMRDPHDRDTFERSKLDLEDRKRNEHVYALHRDLIRLRREDPALRTPGHVDGSVLGPEAFVLRYMMQDHRNDRLLLVNFGRDLHYNPAPEPLLAPPEGMRWKKLWSTEEPSYHGCGYPAVETDENWIVPGHAAVVLKPEAPSESDLRKEKRLEQETVARRKRERSEHA